MKIKKAKFNLDEEALKSIGTDKKRNSLFNKLKNAAEELVEPKVKVKIILED